MKYVSTRGTAPELDFEAVLLAGLAVDGGLYVPDAWPRLGADELRALAGKSYAEIATRVMAPFVGDVLPEAEFADLVAETYAGFDHRAVAPLRQIDSNDWILELFHGPTLAFKDYALQLVGRLFDRVLKRRGERITIVGATSGDTGSAAIEACRDRDAIDIFILHPHGRVSDVQRRQMTTVASANVHNIAVDGTFDDCQDALKAMFNDTAFRDEMRLSAVNSINWARVMAQIVYYVAAAVALGAPDRRVSFAVPTGNFGNVFAGYGAVRMGLPVNRLLIGSNRNDILARFFESGAMVTAPVEPSLSPSMDIQVSSNFERLLFDMVDRDPDAVRTAMETFRATGTLSVDNARLAEAKRIFDADRLDDDGTLRVIGETYARTGQLIDPHTAVGVETGRRLRGDSAVPLIVLSTAHPAKFPEAVEKATGVHPALPDHLSDLFERPERMQRLPNDLAAIKDHIRANVSFAGAA